MNFLRKILNRISPPRGKHARGVARPLARMIDPFLPSLPVFAAVLDLSNLPALPASAAPVCASALDWQGARVLARIAS